MLRGLAIRDIVLIEALDLDFADDAGLSVLTGETGAGKSILLDALGLALGIRADRGLVRAGVRQGSVAAVFALPARHPVRERLIEGGIEPEEELILRRVLTADGRSRAFVNDQPVGTALLRSIGDLMVEIHGQHDAHGLLETATHRTLLDSFGRLEDESSLVRARHAELEVAKGRLEAVRTGIEQARREELYWRQVHDELSELDPKAGEEEELAGARARLLDREKLLDALRESLDALGGDRGAAGRLAGVERRIGRILDAAPELLRGGLEAAQRALVETNEALELLEGAARALAEPGLDLERIEERLFALRALARKHRIEVDRLPELKNETARRLDELDHGTERLDELERAVDGLRSAFAGAARQLGVGRAAAAKALAVAVRAELAPLKLDRARFEVGIEPLPEGSWGPNGAERIGFLVAMNPGQTPGPIAKVASGGELSRLMLALKVVLAGIEGASTMVFDEIDTGIGGATADAVGERLARLGCERQVLVVTHAPQVAARASRHWRVGKTGNGRRTTVTVEPLDAQARREEIARMLAGAQITEEARAAAESLIRRSA